MVYGGLYMAPWHIENDLNTVVGIEFYEHKETPGLVER